MDLESMLHIDLHNLEEAQFEGSKYVLTSPRSLEACAHLDVKPVELLYKPLSEFQEELLPQDIPLRTIYSLYDESEQIRQEKLKLCREERNRLLDNQSKQISMKNVKDRLSTLPSEDYEQSNKSKSKGLSKVSLGFEPQIEQKKGRTPRNDQESRKLHKELVSKKDKHNKRSKSATRYRPVSADRRKIQRCVSSASLCSKMIYRSGSVPSIAVPLPTRDEKILKLMKARREEEKKKMDESLMAHRKWEEQKKHDDLIRSVSENRRRQLIAEENRIKSVRKAEEKERLAKEESLRQETHRLTIEESEKKSEVLLMSQLRIKEFKLSEKIKKEKARKDNLDKNRMSREREENQLKELLMARKISEIESASARRDVRLHQESMKKFLDNRHEREAYTQRQNILKSQEIKSQLSTRSSIEQKMKQAEDNRNYVLEQRNFKLEEKRQEEDAKLQRARSTHKQLEAEMNAWKAKILKQKISLENKAQESVSHSMELKAWKARRERQLKEYEQRKNFAKINKEVEKWKRNLELDIQDKERKVEDLEDERERRIAETRAMAKLTQTLRDDIREKYVSDTFDKKVLQAHMHASLDTQFRSPSKKNKCSAQIF